MGDWGRHRRSVTSRISRRERRERRGRESAKVRKAKAEKGGVSDENQYVLLSL